MSLGSQRSFDDMGAHLSTVPFCVLDIETTGGRAEDLGVTEIGAVRYEGGVETGVFQTLVDPGMPIPAFITLLTGIGHATVRGAPRLEEAMASFLEFLGDAVIVGHNVRYDMSFLGAASRAFGYGDIENRTVDTAALARRLVRGEVRNLKLSTLAAHFRSPVKPNHRALEDARATAHVLWCLLERAGTIGVTHLDDLLELPTAKGSPHYGKISLADGLPRRSGVYLFRDRHGVVFYVGKAKNLRTRVRSYFYGDTRRSVTNMLRELDSIDHILCPTELEAEVLEVRLIAEHAPRHNRRSKPSRSPHWLKLTAEEFPRLSLVRTPKPDGLLLVGPFRGREAARLVMEAVWDAVPIRRCTGPPGRRSARCSFAQMGRALCPCDGSLPEAQYRAVVDELTHGFEHEPSRLLAPLADRIQSLASSARFEDAAWVRDRRSALVRALERRAEWRCLQTAGTIRAEGPGGGALIRAGRLEATWPRGDQPPLLDSSPAGDPAEAADSGALAEEAHLVWNWLSAPGTRLVDSDGPLVMPASPARPLERIAI
jgi:DNA polymerase-3 subunit epsilon